MDNSSTLSAASDLVMHCLPNALMGVAILKWVNKSGPLKYKVGPGVYEVYTSLDDFDKEC